MSIQPWQSTSQFGDAFRNVRPPTSTNSFGAPNDFGRVINELLLTAPFPDMTEQFSTDMKLVGELEGFAVKDTEDSYHVRDYRVMVERGVFIAPCVLRDIVKAVHRCRDRGIFRKDNACIEKWTGGNIAIVGSVGVPQGQKILFRNQYKTNDLSDGAKTKTSNHYFEGGNVFTVTGSDGRKRVICGVDNVTVTHQMLRINGYFKAESKQQDSTSRLYLAKKVPEMIEEIGGQIASRIAADEIKRTLGEMNRMGMIKSFSLETTADWKAAKRITTEYLAQREFVEQILIPNDFKVDKTQMVYLPQIDAHLDLLMTPGPNGTILMQDYEESVKLLQMVRQHLSDSNELFLLERMIETTRTFGGKVSGIMQEAKEKLEKAGFTVIPAPGAFFSEEGNVSFFNAISGFSQKTSHYYYIVGGTSVGGHLGSVLMDAFTEFLKRCCSENVHVYFVGRDPNIQFDFSKVDAMLNMGHFGVHCLSLETDITAA